jgi:hypothetical protein
MVEKMTSRERIEKWNELSIDPGEVECQPLTPLEKWRLEVAKEVAKEKRREEVEAQQRRKDEEEQQEQGRITSWKPSVLTSSSMRSAKKELQNQFESSSRESPAFSSQPSIQIQMSHSLIGISFCEVIRSRDSQDASNSRFSTDLERCARKLPQ